MAARRGRAFGNLAACAFVLLSAVGLADAQASAERSSETETKRYDPIGLVIGAKAGGGLGAPFNAFGANLVAEVELGYRLPLPAPIDRSLELFSAFAYGAPHTEGSADKPDLRLPARSFSYALTEQIAALSFGLLYRFELPAHVVAPYAAAAARLHMTRTKVHGSSGPAAFGENQETSSAWGLSLAAGLEIYLGPGAALAELQFGYAGVNDVVLRNTNLGAFNLLVGYRLFIWPAESHSARTETTSTRNAEDSAGTRAAIPPVPAAPSALAAPAQPNASAVGDAAAEPAEPEPVVPLAPPASDPSGEGTPAQLRGHVQAFSGTALRATITLYPSHLQASTNEQGDFQLDVPPGAYAVRVRAHGYKSQSRNVKLEANAVTVLNVDLGKK